MNPTSDILSRLRQLDCGMSAAALDGSGLCGMVTSISQALRGGFLTLAAMARGIADRLFRDINHGIGFGWPVFRPKPRCSTVQGRVVKPGIEVPVRFEGIAIPADDYVAADRGAVILRASFGCRRLQTRREWPVSAGACAGETLV